MKLKLSAILDHEKAPIRSGALAGLLISLAGILFFYAYFFVCDLLGVDVWSTRTYINVFVMPIVFVCSLPWSTMIIGESVDMMILGDADDYENLETAIVIGLLVNATLLGALKGAQRKWKNRKAAASGKGP